MPEGFVSHLPNGALIIFATGEEYTAGRAVDGERVTYRHTDFSTRNLPWPSDRPYPSIYTGLSTQIADRLQAGESSVAGVAQHLSPSEELRRAEVRQPIMPFEVDVLGRMRGAMFHAQEGLLTRIDADVVLGRDLVPWGSASFYDRRPDVAAGFGGQIHLKDRHQTWPDPDMTRSSEWSEILEVSPRVVLAAEQAIFVAAPLDTTTVPEFDMAQDANPVDVLRGSRFRAVAERLDYLNAELADDPDWEIDEVDPDSVASFAAFLFSAKPAALPMVGLHPSGFVFAQWKVVPQEGDVLWEGGDGSLIMVFEPSQLVSYAASSGMVESGTNSIAANGIMPVQGLRSVLGFFLSRVAEFEFDED